MATTNDFPSSDVNSYDYVIVGGGTAGCVIASRLAQYLPNKRILVIEGGPSDFMDDRVLNLREWLNLLGGELGPSVPGAMEGRWYPSPAGESPRDSRTRLLVQRARRIGGGCGGWSGRAGPSAWRDAASSGMCLRGGRR